MVAVRSARWDDEVTQSHQMIVRVDVLRRGETVLTIDGGTPATGGVTDGSVQVERSLIRRTAQLTLVDPGDKSLVPSTPGHPLSVYGNELRIWRGVRYADGTDELLPIFTGPIADWDDSGYPAISVNAFDRADRVQRHRFERPTAIDRGTNYILAIQRVLQTAWPEIVMSFPTSNLTSPGLLFEEQGDPWEQAKKMAASLGNELLFDAMGVCTMQSEPDPASQSPLFTYVEGDNLSYPAEAARSVLLSAGRSSSNRGRYNKVIATGENTDNSATYRAEAWDADPTSPTYIGGDYGVVPRWYASQFIASSGQAAGAARSVLRSELGQTDPVPFSIVANPALELGDVVRLVRTRTDLDVTRSMDKLSLPLSVEGAMDVVTRNLVSIEDATT